MTEDDDISVEEAIKNLAQAYSKFDEQDPETQMRLRSLATKLHEMLEQADRRQRARDAAAAERRRQANKQRKELRDRLIPEWCEENLRPGMIVKVKSKNAGYRRIVSIKPHRVLEGTGFVIDGELRGQHVGYKRTRNPETGEKSWSLTEGDNITNHILKNVQGVVLRTTSRGEPVVTPIMDLVEGRITL